jgi:hypothetical protein
MWRWNIEILKVQIIDVLLGVGLKKGLLINEAKAQGLEAFIE